MEDGYEISTRQKVRHGAKIIGKRVSEERHVGEVKLSGDILTGVEGMYDK